MAKKILAVVMAVMVALSAMAITAFADQQITLIKQSANTGLSVITVSFDIPIYPNFGYTGTDRYIKVFLPTDFGGNVISAEADKTIDWSVWVGGSEYRMKSSAMPTNAWAESASVDEQRIYFGYQAHDYIKLADGTEMWTTVPQDITYNGTSVLHIVGTFEFPQSYGQGYAETWRLNNDYFNLSKGGKYTTVAHSETFDSSDNPITQSTSYSYSWNYTVNGEVTDTAGTYVFVNSPFTYQGLIQDQNGATPNLHTVFSWDHTIANRAALYGADTVQLVVKLDKPVNGYAAYNLWSVSDLLYSNNQNQYWSHSNYVGRKYVSTVTVNGSQSELVFDVPIEVLQSSVYGDENVEFAITQNILLNDPTIFSNGNYIQVDRDKVGSYAGSWGDLSWSGDQYNGTGNSVVYKGSPAIYAAQYVENESGEWSLSKVNGDVVATDLYLNIVETADDSEDVKPPVEDTDQNSDEEGDDTLNVTDDEGNTPATPDEKNPHTGIALAVVPMLVAAAAAVVAKKH